MSEDSIIAAPGIGRTSNAFRVRLIETARGLKLDPDAIAVMFSIESGFRSDAVNKSTGATGISQELPITLKQQGIDPEEYANWTALMQLDLPAKRYAALANKIKTGKLPGDYYVANFLPIYIGAPDETLIGANPGCRKDAPTWEEASKLTIPGGLTHGSIYCGNYGFDADKDGLFSLGDVRAFFNERYAGAAMKPRIPVNMSEDWKAQYKEDIEQVEDSNSSLPLIGGLGLLALWGVWKVLK